MSEESFNRVERLAGSEAMKRLAAARVIIFGVGGVGGWAAEALVRSGIGSLTIVDADCVCTSNINRQPMALHSTIGKPKVEVLAARLLDINPSLDLSAIEGRYDASTADSFHLDSYDYVVDAIDSLADKALLILRATRSKTTLVASMGAALRIDPTRIAVAEFRNVKGCRLAAALRNRFKRCGEYPARKFKCVYTDEPAVTPPADIPADNSGAMSFGKVAVNGALMQVTATFGMTLASLVINDIIRAR